MATKNVIVTTQHRGVFFGEIDEAHMGDRSITMRNCRNIIYWSQETNGFQGLAASGPGKGSKIAAVAPSALLHDITSVTECTEAAAKALRDWK